MCISVGTPSPACLNGGRKAPHFAVWPLEPKLKILCLEPGKIEALKMHDLQTKSAINSNNLQVQH